MGENLTQKKFLGKVWGFGLTLRLDKTNNKQKKTIAILSKITKDIKTRTKEVIVPLYVGQCIMQGLYLVLSI